MVYGSGRGRYGYRSAQEELQRGQRYCVVEIRRSHNGNYAEFNMACKLADVNEEGEAENCVEILDITHHKYAIKTHKV